MERSRHIRRGAAFMVTSALFFAALGAGVKALSSDLPTSMVVFFRNAVGLLVLTPLLLSRGLGELRTRHLGEHLIRGLFGLAAMYCWFLAISRIPLAEATLLNQSMPLFIPIVEWLWLREPLSRRLFLPLGVGFLGLLLILKPGTSVFTPFALVGAASALFGAVAQVGIRRLTHSEPTIRIVFYFALIASSFSLPPALWAWVTPRPSVWVTVAVMGACATAGQLCLTRAYRHAPAAQVGPFLYTGVVFAAAFDYLLWGRPPDAFTVGGAALVCVAAILTLRLRLVAPEAL
jgi:drug/metabolite transporter (DMT)-like permease